MDGRKRKQYVGSTPHSSVGMIRRGREM